MASSDTIVRHASYGLELVDVLTGESLIGSSALTLREISPSPPVSGTLEPVIFLVNRSRWVVEDLDHDVVFDVDADFYLGAELVAGVDVPPVPDPYLPGILVTVELMPRTGYPFPRTLTRAVGAVRVDPNEDPNEPLVPGADVTVTPIHSFAPLVTGTPFPTKTADDGQYVVWFLPDVTLDPPSPIAFDVHVEATVDIGGVPTFVQGDVTNQPLTPQAFNGAETVYLSP